MKIKNFVFILLLVIPFVGCKVKKKNNSEKQSAMTEESDFHQLSTQDSSRVATKDFQQLSGTWHLVHSRGGFAGINETIPQGAVKWTFNTTEATLKIENNYAGKGIVYTVMKSGEYPYRIISNKDTHFFILDGREIGAISIRDEQLVIDGNRSSHGVISDGFVVQLER